MAKRIETLRRQVRRLSRNREGATALEYSLIAAGVALAVLLSVFAAGETLNQGYEDTASQMAAQDTGASDKGKAKDGKKAKKKKKQKKKGKKNKKAKKNKKGKKKKNK